MTQRWRRSIAFLISLIGFGLIILLATPAVIESEYLPPVTEATGPAIDALNSLEIKGRAPKTDYSRDQFGNGWATTKGCTTREIILYRDLKDVIIGKQCAVQSGRLDDPYTGLMIEYAKLDASRIQIDHVVALSDAWQKGAQNLSREQRIKLANDPMELLAVDGTANQQKLDGDAATWLPSNKSFRCDYISRQIAVKQKYALWVTEAEKAAMVLVLAACPNQQLPAQ